MTMEACQTVVFGLVLSHLDYSYAILVNLPSNAIHKMQPVQNMAACIVLQDEAGIQHNQVPPKVALVTD